MKHTIDGHEMTITKIERSDLPQDHLKIMNPDDFSKFWVVTDRCGNPYFWLASGYGDAPRQIVAWYRSGNPFGGYGDTLKDAVDLALRSAWMYA